MQTRLLGKTGIEVTELCLGALPMGPLQKNLDVATCAEVIAAGLRGGITFVDTAQMYGTYEPIRLAMEQTGIRPVLASKSNKKTYAEMTAAVDEALTKLGIDYIDIFLLHAAREGENTFDLYKDALRALLDLKAAGKVKAVGVSTHNPVVTALAADIDEIEVVFPIINKDGRGIVGGTRDDMLAAIEKVARAGKGLYLMKALAGGALIGEYDAAMKFVRRLEGYASVAVGMVAVPEVEFNLKYFNGEAVSDIPDSMKGTKRVIIFSNACKSCGACKAACPNMAIHFDENNKACVDHAVCLTCGYCTPVCPEFAIRIV